MQTSFYSELKSISNFYELTQIQNYSPVPEDWYLIVTDIKGSTKAIEEGRYKDVNFIGAMSIVALLNLAKEIEIPFLFGGDGASIFIPPVLYERACLSLNNVRAIVKTNYLLDLRIGVIRVSEIYKDDKKILMTKHSVSDNYTQAIVRGGGLEHADHLIKNHFETYTLEESEASMDYADFTSLECRWQEIPSPKDEVLSVLIKAKDEESDAIYANLFHKLDAIFGVYDARHPIKEKNLHLSFNPKNLKIEASLYSPKYYIKLFHILGMMAINALGGLLISFKIGQWGEYKNNILHTSDTQKFDDMFRTVISATKEETQALETYLQEEFLKGNLHFGIHKSATSLMTCLVFQRHGKHVHFVDGSNGGYALAAKEMKKNLL